jgi:predicted DCC family thiol-disulfide oxidoreductase YuxK
MGSPDPVNSKSIILFDGLCNLCSGSVQFVIRRDKINIFLFASLQSKFGQEKLSEFKLDQNNLYSIILIRDNSFFQHSDAILDICKQLGGGWMLLYGLKIIPRFIRDSIYNWISNNRYRFFGKKQSCWIPTPELKSKFIE